MQENSCPGLNTRGCQAGPMSPETRSDRSLDSVFDCLSHPRRRRVVEHMRESGRTGFTLDGLVEALGGGDELRVELYHVHLPKLAAAGIVEREDGTVRFRGVSPVLDAMTA